MGLPLSAVTGEKGEADNVQKRRARSLETSELSPRSAETKPSHSTSAHSIGIAEGPKFDPRRAANVHDVSRGKDAASVQAQRSPRDQSAKNPEKLPARTGGAKRSSVRPSGSSPCPPVGQLPNPPPRAVRGGPQVGRNTRISMQETTRPRSALFEEADALVKQNRFSCPGTTMNRESFSASSSRASIPAQELDVGALALNSIDHVVARQICSTTTMQELEALELPAGMTSTPEEAEEADPPHLGTWMIWMVHRVKLDDPSLTQINFHPFCMPAPEDEPRIAEKLLKSIANNAHIVELRLANSNLQGGQQAQLLAEALVANKTLRVLDVALNFLSPADLQRIFTALAQNATLEELRCSSQFCDQHVGRDGYAALAETLKTNQTLRKVGMQLLDAHWRDQINRGIVRNTETARVKRYEASGRSGVIQHFGGA